MDARTGVQRPQPTNSAWNAKPAASRPTGPAVAMASPDPKAGPGSADGDDRLSVDPMRATDRYRLVMPYSEQV